MSDSNNIRDFCFQEFEILLGQNNGLFEKIIYQCSLYREKVSEDSAYPIKFENFSFCYSVLEYLKIQSDSADHDFMYYFESFCVHKINSFFISPIARKKTPSLYEILANKYIAHSLLKNEVFKNIYYSGILTLNALKNTIPHSSDEEMILFYDRMIPLLRKDFNYAIEEKINLYVSERLLLLLLKKCLSYEEICQHELGQRLKLNKMSFSNFIQYNYDNLYRLLSHKDIQNDHLSHFFKLNPDYFNASLLEKADQNILTFYCCSPDFYLFLLNKVYNDHAHKKKHLNFLKEQIYGIEEHFSKFSKINAENFLAELMRKYEQLFFKETITHNCHYLSEDKRL